VNKRYPGGLRLLEPDIEAASAAAAAGGGFPYCRYLAPRPSSPVRGPLSLLFFGEWTRPEGGP
jgi:hypothetical protein